MFGGRIQKELSSKPQSMAGLICYLGDINGIIQLCLPLLRLFSLHVWYLITLSLPWKSNMACWTKTSHHLVRWFSQLRTCSVCMLMEPAYRKTATSTNQIGKAWACPHSSPTANWLCPWQRQWRIPGSICGELVLAVVWEGSSDGGGYGRLCLYSQPLPMYI